MPKKKKNENVTIESSGAVTKLVSGAYQGKSAMPIFLARRYTSRVGPLDLLDFAARSYSPEEVLEALIDGHPDVSAAVWKMVTLANTGLTTTVLDERGNMYDRGQKWLEKFVARQAVRSADSGEYVPDRSINTIAVQALFSLITTGSAVAELVVDQDLEPGYIWMRPSSPVEFEQDAAVDVPFWNTGQKKVKMDTDRFVMQVIMPRVDYPYPISPIFPVMSVVFFQIKLLTDAMQVWNKLSPRLDVQLDEKALIDNLRQRFGALDMKKLKELIDSIKTEFIQSFKTIKPEDPLFHTASIKINYLESTHGGQIFDMRPMMELLSQQICSAVKVMPALLGRSIGKTGTYNAQELSMMQSDIRFYQVAAQAFISQCLSRALKYGGYRGRVEAEFTKMELRGETEVEQWRSTKIVNVCREYMLRVISKEEARKALRRMAGPLPVDADEGFDEWAEKIANVDTNQEQPESPTTGTEDDEEEE